MKTCFKCRQDKPESEFSPNKRQKDGLLGQCKECQRQYMRAHYKRERETYLAKAKVSNKARRSSIQAYVRQRKAVPCADCGSTYPYYVMDFDHVRGEKSFTIGPAAGSKSIEQIKQEIEKCDIVCSNCHRIRTFTRAGRE